MNETKITGAGIFAGIPMADYLGQPCPGPAVQATNLKHLWDECPAYAYALWSGNPRAERDEDTAAKDFGSAFHMLLLEPENFDRAYAVKPDGMTFATKEGKAWRAEQEESGREIITAAEHERMLRMCEEIELHPTGQLVVARKAMAEATMAAQDPETGLWLKARPDLLMTDAPPMAVNLKTAARPNPRLWQRQASDLGYHVSAAFTRRVARLVGLDASLPYAFLVVGSKPPHLPFVATLKDSAMAWGDLIVTAALRRFADCLSSGKWPGYADAVVEIDLPAWEETRLQRLHEAGAFEAPERKAA